MTAADSTPQAPPPPNRDAATLVLLQAGNPDGLRHLVEDHAASTLAGLRRAFARFLPAPEIEDALTAALVRIWEQPSRFDPRLGTLRAWLFVVARNSALSTVRRRQRQLRDISIEDFDSLLGKLASTPSEQERLRRIADLHGCLSELSPMQRAVLLADLAANGTESSTVLAQRLGTSPIVIYSARHRGRAEIGRMMQRLGHYVGRSIAPNPPGRPLPTPTPEFG